VPRGSLPLPPVVGGPVRAAPASSAPVAEPDGVVVAAPAFVPLMVSGDWEPPGFDGPPASPAPPLAPNAGPDRIEIEVAGVVARLPGDVAARRLAEVVRGLRDLAIGRPA